MRIGYIGSGEFGITCLEAVVASSHELALVVTQPARRAGRGRKPASTPVARWAAGHCAPLIEAGNINAPEIAAKVGQFKPDLLLVIAFGQKISQTLLDIPPKGAINVHASLLPKYRGAAPINWAIINGEKETGISIITVAEKMDAGDILAQVKTEIGFDESAGRLHDRLAQLAAPLLMETLDKIADDKAVRACQDESKATRAPKLQKPDGYIDFSESAELLYRKILGLWPWPGASASYVSQKTNKPERVTFARADILRMPNPGELPAGTIDEDLNVICGQDKLQIMQIKPEGSRLMSFADFVNGRHTQPGDMFTKIQQ